MPEDLNMYNTRRIQIEKEVNKLPRGTKQNLSFDLRIHASLISSVLSGRVIDEKVLDQIEEWLEYQPARR